MALKSCGIFISLTSSKNDTQPACAPRQDDVTRHGITTHSDLVLVLEAEYSRQSDRLTTTVLNTFATQTVAVSSIMLETIGGSMAREHRRRGGRSHSAGIPQAFRGH